ncbi:phospholipase D-like domain-containing protein [Cyanobium sp. NIES-981]|uniref:phospholipase D-like domain-containing protein n=1 Tax=Cyanobium sp. NIES-981 TaxID=1851505 RepID=UPI00155F603F|nr:phospholipase D-like domain-containing protein [Cyanobium sp. NIES-981]
MDVHITLFSITDQLLAAALLELARDCPLLSLRILCDWCQGGPGSGRLIQSVLRLSLPNLEVRFKKDQPYLYDADTQSLKWSYKASRGLLHHKMLSVNRSGRPVLLAFGSYNWTARAAQQSYENLLVLRDDQPSRRAVMVRYELEFRELWCSPAASLSSQRSQEAAAHILSMYTKRPSTAPQSIAMEAFGDRGRLPPHLLDDLGQHELIEQDTRIAFSFRACDSSTPTHGMAAINHAQRFDLTKPSGRVKSVPLSMTVLSLDVIHRALQGERLLVAMFAFSRRVAEFSALLDAARRGVRIQVLTDRRTSAGFLREMGRHRDLQITIKTGQRFMHQKYVVHPASNTVVSGTANFTTDSLKRHAENRVLFNYDAKLCRAFEADFRRIWARLDRYRPSARH